MLDAPLETSDFIQTDRLSVSFVIRAYGRDTSTGYWHSQGLAWPAENPENSYCADHTNGTWYPGQ